MELETFKKVISQVSKVTRLVTFHLMGEPLVHPELRQFLDLCEEKNLKVFFVTNGVLLKDPSVLLHPAIQQVSFSLHSYPDNFPGKLPLNWPQDRRLRKLFYWRFFYPETT